MKFNNELAFKWLLFKIDTTFKYNVSYEVEKTLSSSHKNKLIDLCREGFNMSFDFEFTES